MRFIGLCLCLGCSSTELDVVLEGEDGPVDQPWDRLPVGANLISHVDVDRVAWESGYDDPNITTYTPGELTFAIDGGELASCGGGTCVTATGTTLVIRATTPDGVATGTRRVATDLRLAAFTPRWGHVTNDALHLEVGATTRLDLVFREQGGGVVSGHADYETTGPIAIAGAMVTATAAGDATVFAPSHPDAPPLAIRAVTRDDSLASITSFAADRMFYEAPLSKLTLYTESPAYINSFVIEAFDAGGALVLPDLSFTARGAGLAPASLTDGPCTTEDYCFLHPRLPDGVDELDTQLELSAGAATQQIPVHIVRAAY